MPLFRDGFRGGEDQLVRKGEWRLSTVWQKYRLGCSFYLRHFLPFRFLELGLKPLFIRRVLGGQCLIIILYVNYFSFHNETLKVDVSLMPAINQES
jgi:hypothetical protein